MQEIVSIVKPTVNFIFNSTTISTARYREQEFVLNF